MKKITWGSCKVESHIKNSDKVVEKGGCHIQMLVLSKMLKKNCNPISNQSMKKLQPSSALSIFTVISYFNRKCLSATASRWEHSTCPGLCPCVLKWATVACIRSSRCCHYNNILVKATFFVLSHCLTQVTPSQYLYLPRTPAKSQTNTPTVVYYYLLYLSLFACSSLDSLSSPFSCPPLLLHFVAQHLYPCLGPILSSNPRTIP